MTITTTLKTGALTLAVLFATASVAMAAPGWMDTDAKVKSQPKSQSQTVNWVAEGQKVNVQNCGPTWCKVKIPGQDGFVKKSQIDFGGYYPAQYGYNDGFCVSGQYAQFCINN